MPALCIKFNSKKTEAPPALYDLVQLDSAVHNNNIIVLDMPLTRTYIGHPLDLIMALQGSEYSVVVSQIWEAVPIEVMCLPFNTFKKEY